MIAEVMVEVCGDDREGELLTFGQVTEAWGPVTIVLAGESVVEWWFTDSDSAGPGLAKRWPKARWHRDDQKIRCLFKRLVLSDEPVRVPVLLKGTPFQLAVWKEMLSVGWGRRWSYRQLAHSIGKPSAVRAVASAVANNPISWIIPCHRIIYADGRVGRYRWGSELKNVLLDYEKTH